MKIIFDSCKIIFVHIKLYENIFTIRAWWALIEKVAPCAMLNRQIEMACRGEKEVTCCVRGYHVYKDIWATAIGEELGCGREPTNMADRYAVAVLKQETVIGYLPKKISKVCSLFLRRGGSIRCTVTGSRRHPSDLATTASLLYVRTCPKYSAENFSL